MSIRLEMQCIDVEQYSPETGDLERWVEACPISESFTDLTIRIVDDTESRALNHEYRGRDQSTNVLSFPGTDDSLPDELNTYLGDLVICAAVVNAEAAQYGMKPEDRWLHIVVHGVLHLLGYDHMEDAERETMEKEERRIVSAFGLSDPYTID